MNSEILYYYMEGEEARGPVSAAEIRRMLRAEKLTPEALVSAEGSEDWQPLYQYAELCVVPAKMIVERPQARRQSGSSARREREAREKISPPEAEPPAIARLVNVLALVVVVLGVLAGISSLAQGFGVMGVSVIIYGAVMAFLLYAFGVLLTWVHDIRLSLASRK